MPPELLPNTLHAAVQPPTRTRYELPALHVSGVCWFPCLLNEGCHASHGQNIAILRRFAVIRLGEPERCLARNTNRKMGDRRKVVIPFRCLRLGFRNTELERINPEPWNTKFDAVHRSSLFHVDAKHTYQEPGTVYAGTQVCSRSKFEIQMTDVHSLRTWLS